MYMKSLSVVWDGIYLLSHCISASSYDSLAREDDYLQLESVIVILMVALSLFSDISASESLSSKVILILTGVLDFFLLCLADLFEFSDSLDSFLIVRDF